MGIKSTVLLLVLVVVFVKLRCSMCFSFTKTPSDPLVVFVDKNKTNVELRWEWNLGGDVLNHLKIKRYRKDNNLATVKTLASFYANGGSQQIDTTKYTLNVQNVAKGDARFVINDVTNQGANKDNSPVNIMANVVYVYQFEADLPLATPPEYVSRVDLNVFKTPVITSPPTNQMTSSRTVTFQCAAEGKPSPTISWEKIGSSETFSQGSPLTIKGFNAQKSGVYKCTATSVGISEKATALAYVQLPTCGSGCIKEELGIRFTGLTYTSDYENPNSVTYRSLKSKIEIACLTAYALKNKPIQRCEVLRYRSGSVVAVVELGWATNTIGPKVPLEEAIDNGSFAGYNVQKQFVSPTSAPTEEPESINPTQQTSTVMTAESGQRASGAGGLSTGGLVALLVVLSIIFIVIIVVLIVCMLKRRKPKDSGKPYKEDSRAAYEKPVSTTPLKSQPFDPTYDDPYVDRYPNGEGPPPQYTPSDYAEVSPSHDQPDESQVEWDKSVKDEMWI